MLGGGLMKLAQRKQQRTAEMAHKEFRAIEFDFRRRVVDDIEEMLEKAGAFTTEVFLVDEDGQPVHEDVDAGIESDSVKLRRMAESLADYVIS
jgi:hypothetical protein